jgi:nucleoside phosphorylase
MGIAAGIRNRIKIGEVALSDQVVAYEPASLVKGKHNVRKHISRPVMPRIVHGLSQDLSNYLASFEAKSGRVEKIFENLGGEYPKKQGKSRAEFQKHVAVKASIRASTIASGEKLLKDGLTLYTTQRIHGKIEVGEMEAVGLAIACEWFDVPWIVVRGISDFGDRFKDDRFHDFAAMMAASATYDFVKYGLSLDVTLNKKQSVKRRRLLVRRKAVAIEPSMGKTSTNYELGRNWLNSAVKEYKGWSIPKARALIEKGKEPYRNQFLVPYLRWKYPNVDILTAADREYPVAVYTAPSSQANDPDSILQRPLYKTRQRDDQLIPQSARYRAIAHLLGLKPYDRPCFTMKRAHIGESLKLECEMGSYLRALDTCDELNWEISTQITKLNGETQKHFEKFDTRLPFRRRLHDAVRDPICDGSRRSAAIAASVVIACYDENELIILVQRRGYESIAVHTGMLHVIPSFMFQPATSNLESEFSIMHNFYREYLEEMFNRPEPERNVGDWRYFYSDQRLKYFQSLRDNGKIEIQLTGLAINLLNLRPEVCLLVFIKDPEWYRHHRSHPDRENRFEFNDEWMQIVQMESDAETAVARIKYQRDEASLLMENRGIAPENFVPPGAAAFWLGKRALDKRLLS